MNLEIHRACNNRTPTCLPCSSSNNFRYGSPPGTKIDSYVIIIQKWTRFRISHWTDFNPILTWAWSWAWAWTGLGLSQEHSKKEGYVCINWTELRGVPMKPIIITFYYQITLHVNHGLQTKFQKWIVLAF